MNSREFAIAVVRRLQDAGYTALWAGGCVRDQALGKTPKDYDVATNATPDQVRDLFGHRKTLAIGVSFGVITVLGPKSAEPIEIATFRRDTGYSDGRRPDAVEFTDAREDAIRRDFTINGMFFDPIAEKLVDYVGGQDDLERQVIRAIGNPHERIEEDKLRMLRAIRFAATFDFKLEAETLSAVQQHASELTVVSGERIGAELRRMLRSPNRSLAVQLLQESKLLDVILPEFRAMNDSQWHTTLNNLKAFHQEDFACALVLLLLRLDQPTIVGRIAEDWKLSNDEKKLVNWMLSKYELFTRASKLPWSQLQPFLIQPEAESMLAVLDAEGRWGREVDFCRERLAWPSSQLDPAPFLDGAQLKKLGIPPGPLFGQILNSLRAKQLDGEIQSVSGAVELAQKMAQAPG